MSNGYITAVLLPCKSCGCNLFRIAKSTLENIPQLSCLVGSCEYCDTIGTFNITLSYEEERDES